MAPGAEKLGNQLGSMASNYMEEQGKKYEGERNASGSPVDAGDPLGPIDNILGAAWYGMKQTKDYISDIGISIAGYTGSVIDDLGLTGAANTITGGIDTVLGYTRGMSDAVNGITGSVGATMESGIMAAGRGLGNGVSAFAQRTGKWVSDGLFGNDPEPVVGYGRVAGIYTDKKGNIRDSADNRFLSGKLEYGSKDYEYVMKQLGYTDEDFQIKENKKTGEVKITQQSTDRLSRQTTYYKGENITLDQYENYYNSNGKILKASDTLFIYNGDSVDRVNRAYDASGENVYETDVYTRNNKTGEYDLQYRDVWLRDTSGNVMTNYKQGDYNFVMNNNIGTQAVMGDDGQIGYRNTNTSGTVGCLVSQAANFFGFMGLQNDPDSQLYGHNVTPESVDNLLDDIDGYQEGNASMNQNALADALDIYYRYESKLTIENYRRMIDERLDKDLPTIAYVPNHFVSIAGVRYNSSGNRTDYLIRNSSRNGFTTMSRNTLYGQRKGRIRSIGWFYR